jgi:ATP-dependent Lon protease
MVTGVEKTENSLKEARERVNKLMEKNNSKEYDFAERLEVAKSELNKESERAQKNNVRRYVQTTVQHYCFKRGIDTPSNNVPITPL